MRSVKQSSIVALTKAFAEESAASGLYAVRPTKSDWAAIVTKVTADGGMLRIPYAFSKLNGEMFGVWVKAYDAAKRRVAKGQPLTKAAPKPKARKRTAKAGTAKPKASAAVPAGTVEFAGIMWTPEQVQMLTALLASK